MNLIERQQLSFQVFSLQYVEYLLEVCWKTYHERFALSHGI